MRCADLVSISPSTAVTDPAAEAVVLRLVFQLAISTHPPYRGGGVVKMLARQVVTSENGENFHLAPAL
jgi:hypothetical protein